MLTEFLQDDQEKVFAHANKLIRSGLYAFRFYNQDDHNDLLLEVNAFDGVYGMSKGRYTELPDDGAMNPWNEFSYREESIDRWDAFDRLSFTEKAVLMKEQLDEEEYDSCKTHFEDFDLPFFE